jgi:hypothetical protein
MSAQRGGRISRREAFRRAGLLTMGAGMPFSFVACAEQTPAAWTMQVPDTITAAGYGTDPDLVHPAPAPWPRTLTDQQLNTLSALVDILIPAQADLPSATEVGVVEVIDEWVSAPYPAQRQHRSLLLSGLDWCDRESARRFGTDFLDADAVNRLAIIDDIAYPDRPASQDLEGPRQFFAGLRQLAAGAYYTSPEGVRELGYMGNVPIAGDYPGPSDEAMDHLEEQLAVLGLSL